MWFYSEQLSHIPLLEGLEYSWHVLHGICSVVSFIIRVSFVIRVDAPKLTSGIHLVQLQHKTLQALCLTPPPQYVLFFLHLIDRKHFFSRTIFTVVFQF